MGFKIVLNRCYGGFGISEKAVNWLRERGEPHDKAYVIESMGWRPSHCGLHRHDPLLVECVETLGEEASGDSARLEVVEINQPLYRINEYDGAESIEEPEGLRWTNASVLEV
jgi:hypothetical protein